MILKKLFSEFKKSLVETAANPLQGLLLSELVKLNIAAKQIDLQSRKLVSTTLAGDKLASFRGRGMDFDESRVYQPGDDVRLIDWRVTARSGVAHTKVYREERERPIYCFVDMTSSMWFGTRNTFKAVIAAQAASLIAWAASNNGDRLGAVLCSEQKILALKPAAGKRGILQLLSLLSEQKPLLEKNSDPTLFAKSLWQLRHVAKPGSLIFLFTDGRQLDKTAEQHLARLSQHCEIILGFISDPLEQQLPTSGIYTFSDGQRNVTYDAGDKILAADYARSFTTRFENLKSLCDRYQLALFSLSTQESPADSLKRIFTTRKIREH